MSGVQTIVVSEGEDGLRLDRWFAARFPALSFGHLNKLLRTGQVRVNGARVKTSTRLEAGQSIRVPPLRPEDSAPKPAVVSRARAEDEAFLRSLILHEDRDVLVLNKPFGLAVQGGSGTTRHIDGMLDAFTDKNGERPRLVHRLDRDTAGCLVLAKTRSAAAELGRTFRTRSARKIYWALVGGVPTPHQGRISTYLAKERGAENERMRVARHGEAEASHAITYYSVVEKAGKRAAWLSLKPVTGRTHQLRAHLEHIGHAILGDPKYGAPIEGMPEDLPNKLMLMARRITVPHPRGGVLDVTAPLPEHFKEAFDLFGFDASAYDPIIDAPEE